MDGNVLWWTGNSGPDAAVDVDGRDEFGDFDGTGVAGSAGIWGTMSWAWADEPGVSGGPDSTMGLYERIVDVEILLAYSKDNEHDNNMGI